MGMFTTTRTVQEVFDEVKRTFGDESAVQVTDTDLFRWINSAQREILITNRILKATGTTNIVGGQNTYDFAALGIVSIQSIYYDDRKLTYRSFQEAEEYILAQDPKSITGADPIMWYEWGGQIHVWPTPTGNLTSGLKVFYIKEPPKVTVLSDTLSIPDSYYENIIQFVLAKAYEMDEDNENASFKLTQFTNRLLSLSEQDDLPNQGSYPRITVLADDM